MRCNALAPRKPPWPQWPPGESHESFLFAVPVAVFTLNFLALSGCGPAEPNAAWSESTSTEEEEVATSRSASALYDGARVKIVPTHSAKCLDVENASMANRARVQQWDCRNGANQWFQVKRNWDGSSFTWTFVASHSGKCLTVQDGANWNGANLQQSDCTGDPSQEFRVVHMIGSSYRIGPALVFKCLDVSNYSLSNGAQVIQWDCSTTGSANQLFYFV